MISFAIGLAGVILVLVLVLLVGIPLTILLSLAPWALGVLGVVLLVKALLEKPMSKESFTPALVALLASAVLRWIL